MALTPFQIYLKSLAAPRPQFQPQSPLSETERAPRVGVRLMTLPRRPSQPSPGLSIRLYRA